MLDIKIMQLYFISLAVIPRSTNMVSLRVISWGVFIVILVWFLHFGGVFNKTIIPLYNLICASGIIVNSLRARSFGINRE